MYSGSSASSISYMGNADEDDDVDDEDEDVEDEDVEVVGGLFFKKAAPPSVSFRPYFLQQINALRPTLIVLLYQ